MLSRQHFGRRHQGGLVLVGHGHEQGVHGHRCLARADIGLQETLHRLLAGEIAAHLGNGPILIGCQMKGKQPANPRVDGRRRRQYRRPSLVAHLSAPQGQRQLENQKLLVDEALPATRRRRQRRREMNVAQRLIAGWPIVLLSQADRQHIGQTRSMKVERFAQQRTQVFGPQVFGKRIDRHHARQRQRQRTGRFSWWDRRPAGRCGIPIKDLHARIVHLPVIAIPLRFAAERQTLTVSESPGRERLIEPHAFQTILAVIAENNTHHRAPIAQRASVDLDDLALYGLNAIRREHGDGAHVVEILIGAGKVEKQIAHGAQAEPLQQLQSGGGDAW